MMTNSEAIEQLKFLNKVDFHIDTKESCEIAISALEENDKLKAEIEQFSNELISVRIENELLRKKNELTNYYFEQYAAAIAEIEQYQKETSSDKIDYAYDLGYQSCLNHNGVGWVDAEEIQKLRKKIKQLKSELEQSVKLPCRVGDKLFSTENGYIEEFKVRSLNHIVNLVEFSRFDETVFLTREEAEQHLKFEVENGN